MSVDEKTARDVMRGILPWRALLPLGIGLELRVDSVQYHEPEDQQVVHADPAEVLQGIRNHVEGPEPRAVQEWARVLHACNFIDFDQFETAGGDAVLEMLWDAAFGRVPTLRQIENAEKLMAWQAIAKEAAHPKEFPLDAEGTGSGTRAPFLRRSDKGNERP